MGGRFDMTVTETVKTAIATHISSTYIFIGLGVGGDSTNPNTNELDAPIGGRISITPTSSGLSALDYKKIFNGSDYTGHTIKEAGIFSAASGGTMLTRVNFDGIGPISSTETFEIIITMEVE
jgi:hypothetical protein